MSDIPAVGIDLGTSNTVIAVVQGNRARVIADRHGRRIHPSVVNFHPDGSVVVGAEAKKRRVIDPANTITSAKRLIGQNFRSEQVQEAIQRSPYRILEGEHQQVMISTRGSDYTVPEVSALVLRYVKALAEREIGALIQHAVITVPANFNDSQREATRIAGEIAGLHVLRVLNEPTAAALAYGYGQGMRNRIVIYDFGGGTFDVTILQLDDQVFEVMSTAGDSFLGGDDIDEVIVQHMVQLFLQQHRIDLRQDVRAMVRLRAVGEQIKCNLSSKPRAVVQVKEIAYGAGGVPVDLHFELTQEQLSKLSGDVVKRSFLICDEALNLAKTAATQIDDVVMVGGTTRMPLVRQAVQGYFSLQPRVDINPDEVVAVGAAIQAAALLRSSGVAQGRPQPPPMPTAERARGVPGKIAHLADGGPELAQRGGTSRGVPSVGAAPGPGAAPLPPPPPADAYSKTVPEMETVLLDVTPRALGIAVVGGYAEVIVPRNAQIPLEQTRRFSTSQDNQQTVRIQVCQGESRQFAENEPLGELVLDDLRQAPRGKVEIEVAFEVDTNGMLQVSAIDTQTGRIQKARVQLLGTVDASKIAALKARQEELPEITGL